MRTGGLLPINVCRTAKSPKNDIHQWKVLCIEGKLKKINIQSQLFQMFMCVCMYMYNFRTI